MSSRRSIRAALLDIYPLPEFNYRRMEACIDRSCLRPGSTSMWAGLRLVNGYSSIRPAGIARRLNSQIHGELDPQIAALIFERSRHGRRARAPGVDGIIVAREIRFRSQTGLGMEARIFER